MQVCRIVWGLLYDRFGYRSCVIFIGTCVTAGVSALPLLEYLGECRCCGVVVLLVLLVV